MRTHGWGGDPPATDDEAVARIVEAALACVGEPHAAADVASVAARVGVTRQTVYRYFPSRRALFQAVAAQQADALVGRVAAHIEDCEDTEDAVVEVVLFCVRTLPVDPHLSFIAESGRDEALIMSPAAPALARRILAELPIDLGHLDDGQRRVLAEHMVRLLQALLLDASTMARSDADLRSFLHACLGPSVHGVTIRR